MKTDRKSVRGRVVSTSVDADADSWPGEAEPGRETQFGPAFTHAPIGMAIFGTDQRLRRANRALCEMLGYSQRELLERTLTDLTHPDDRKRDRALARRLLRGEIPGYRLERRCIAKDGREAWLNLTALLVRDNKDAPSYGMAMVEDVTERRRAEEALRASEERYRSFVVNSSEGIWRFETGRPIDTGLPAEEQLELLYEHGYLAECNDAMARMYGYARADDLIGAGFETLRSALGPDTRADARAFVENGYRRLGAESAGFDADGGKRFFSSNIIGIVVNGYLLRIWGTQRDEAERKTAEAQIEAARLRMRALVAHLHSVDEKERAEVAREMHDVLGQSLTGLKLDIFWLHKRLPNAGDERVRAEMAARVGEMASFLDGAIAAVKNLSTELRPGVLDKFGLPAAVEWQCQEFARRTGLACARQLPEGQPSPSSEVSTALFRILQEALTNVARHAGAKSVRVELNVSGRAAALVVRDDGRGVTEEELSAPVSLGLLGMRERAEALGGSLVVGRGAHGGTVVKASIPFGDDGA
ncbi:MAG TPA: PAS domain S-box protein [Pyrinomonadaceae bacterium]|nr:PAS domain S-box protein [Pyrinomonadaceae bacterium]